MYCICTSSKSTLKIFCCIFVCTLYSGLCVSLRCVVVGCQVPSCYSTGENSDQSEAASEGRHRCGSSDTRDPRGGESEGLQLVYQLHVGYFENRYLKT